jgi:hypothetical protein
MKARVELRTRNEKSRYAFIPVTGIGKRRGSRKEGQPVCAGGLQCRLLCGQPCDC